VREYLCPVLGHYAPERRHLLAGSGFLVSDFGYRVLGIGVRVSGARFRVSGFGFRVRVPGPLAPVELEHFSKYSEGHKEEAVSEGWTEPSFFCFFITLKPRVE